MERETKKIFEERFFAVLVIGFAMILRLVLLWYSSVWIDEAYSIQEMATTSFSNIITTLKNDPGSPAYYFLLRVWVLIFGDSEIAAASLSTLFSSLTPIFTYIFARKIFQSSTAALLATAVIGFNDASLTHSSNIRYYAQLEFLTLLSAGFFWEFATSRKRFFPYVVISALGLYTHAYFFFVLFGQFAIVLFFFQKRLIHFIKAGLFIFILFSPWMLIQLHQSYLQIEGEIGSSYPDLSIYGGAAATFIKAVSNKIFGVKYDHPIALFITAIMIVAGPFLAYNKKGWKPYLVHLVGLIVILATPILISLWKPIFLMGRYDMIITPYVAFCFGYLISQIPFRWAPLIIITLLAIGGVLRVNWFVESGLDEDRKVIQELVKQSTKEDAYVFMGLSRFAPNYYLKQYHVPTGKRYTYPKALEKQAAFIHPEKYSQEKEALVEEGEALVETLKKSGAKRVFLFYVDYPNFNVLEELFDENFTREWTREIKPHPWGPLYQYVVLYKIS